MWNHYAWEKQREFQAARPRLPVATSADIADAPIESRPTSQEATAMRAVAQPLMAAWSRRARAVGN